jgi:hypothetical protein
LSSSSPNSSPNVTESTFDHTKAQIPLSEVRISIEDNYPPAEASISPPNHTPPSPETFEDPDQISIADDVPLTQPLSRVEQQRRQHADREMELAAARKKRWVEFEEFGDPSFSTLSRVTSTPAVKQPRQNPFNIGAEIHVNNKEQEQELQQENVPVEIIAEVELDEPAGKHLLHI